MTHEGPIIRAIELVPWDEKSSSALPPLNCEIRATGTACLLGDNSRQLAYYLRSLGGVDDIRSGELYLFGERFENVSPRHWQQMRLNIGFVSRTSPLLSVLSGIENVVLPALYHKKMSRAEAQATARALLTGLQCDADLSLLPAYLTPLERTQLAIARSAILQPAVLMLEEPYHQLEVTEHNLINAFLADWAQTHALVISTRNLHFVKQQADRIIFAAENKILYFDSWEAFSSSRDATVVTYLQQYQDNYSIW